MLIFVLDLIFFSSLVIPFKLLFPIFKDETASVKGGETPKLDRSCKSKETQEASAEVTKQENLLSKDNVSAGLSSSSKTKAKAPPPPIASNNNTNSNRPPTQQVPSSEASLEKENQVPSSSSVTKTTSNETTAGGKPVKRKAPAPQKPESNSSNGSSNNATSGSNSLSTSSFAKVSDFNKNHPEKQALSSTREEDDDEHDQETDEDIEACRLVLEKHRNQEHHQQITVSLDEEEDEHDKSLSGNNFDDEVVVVDTSHVSIVTIDDNGKDVTIKTTSSTTSQSPSRLDDLHSEGNYRRQCRHEYEDEDDDERGHEGKGDAHSKFSHILDRKQMALHKTSLSQEPSKSHRVNQTESRIRNEASSEEVFLVCNPHDVAKEVIIVSSENVSRDQSYNRQYSAEESRHHRLQQHPHSSDDQLSIRTDSSSSSGQQDQIIMETRKKAPPAKNKEPKKIVHAISVEKQRPRDRYPEEDVFVDKNGDRYHPASSYSPTPPHGRTSGHIPASFHHGNGIQSGLSSSSPPVSHKNNKQHQLQSVTPISLLRREASDAGSVGSFASLNSDRDSNLAAHDASRGSPLTGVMLRHGKVSYRSGMMLWNQEDGRCSFCTQTYRFVEEMLLCFLSIQFTFVCSYSFPLLRQFCTSSHETLTRLPL